MLRIPHASWALLLALFACEKRAEPEPAKGSAPPQAAATSATKEPAATSSGSIEWSEPEGWVKDASRRPLRVATYQVPKAGNEPEDGELAVFHFGPGDGGGIEANIERWVGQFSGVASADVTRDERKSASGLAVHTVEILRGTYASGMPGGPTTPKADFGLLGGIVVSPSGNYFFKFTGPTGTLQRERDKFFQLLESARQKS